MFACTHQKDMNLERESLQTEEETLRTETSSKIVGMRTLIDIYDWRKQLKLDIYASLPPQQIFCFDVDVLSLSMKRSTAFDQLHNSTRVKIEDELLNRVFTESLLNLSHSPSLDQSEPFRRAIKIQRYKQNFVESQQKMSRVLYTDKDKT